MVGWNKGRWRPPSSFMLLACGFCSCVVASTPTLLLLLLWLATKLDQTSGTREEEEGRWGEAYSEVFASSALINLLLCLCLHGSG